MSNIVIHMHACFFTYFEWDGTDENVKQWLSPCEMRNGTKVKLERLEKLQ